MLLTLPIFISGAFALQAPPLAATEARQSPTSAAWIWSAEAASGDSWAPAGAAYFRKVLEIPAGAEIDSAIMDVGADNSAEVFINGKSAGSFKGWVPLSRSDVTGLLAPGTNVLAVRAENEEVGPAGLLMSLKISMAGKKEPLLVFTGDSWTSGTVEAKGWRTAPGKVEGFEAAKVLAENGEPPWGIALPPGSGAKTFPNFSAQGADLEAMNGMLARFYPACNMAIAGTFAMAWLPRAVLWVGDSSVASESLMRARTGNRIARMKVSPEGYVSCHQHEGLAHSEGWPFPLPSQSDGFAFCFSLAGLIFDEPFGVFAAKDVAGWTLEHAKTLGLDETKGWALELTEPGASVTSPAFAVNALVSPFIRVKWNAEGLPAGSKPFIEWTTETETEFSSERRMAFPRPSTSSKFPVQDFDIPVHEITKAAGKITRLRIGFGNPSPGRVTLLRVFSAVDSRHRINNPNYLIGAADYFDWTGDRAWLAANLEKMRRATDYMISEFRVREARAISAPWIGQDGRSGLEYTADGKKLIHKGLGIGGNYWDLLPFGGDDALSTIYLYAALVRMAQIEDFVAAQKLAPDRKPARGSDGPALRQLADAVRENFQKTFWNRETRRFAPIDDQRRFRDYGLTFLNNEAIFYGLATKEQADDILAWLTGARTVEGDTSQGADIYKFRFGPRASTKRNIDYYVYAWSRPEDIAFGDQVQDGGAVLAFTYHDLMARLRYLGADNAWERLREILAWYREVEEAGGPRAYYAVKGRGTLQGGGTAGGLGIDEEFFESVMVPGIILDGFIGFSVRPDGFDLDPRIPNSLENLAVTNVAYRDLLWDVEAAPGTVTFRVKSGEVDSPLSVRLPPGIWTVRILKSEGAGEEVIELSSGPQGFTLPPGKLQQLTITKNQP